MTVRTGLIIINVLALLVIIGIVGYRVLSVRRNPEAKPPQNLRPFMTDEELEGRKLERVLLWALWCSVIVAAALPVYWLWEPTREKDAVAQFNRQSAQRGATLFANESMPAYDSTKSLRCANCHGTDASGGSTTFVIKPPDSGSNLPLTVTWRAPALNTVLSRFSPDQLNQIITYGRPGTPMPAWGIEGGGPKNDQSVADLVSYLESIQLTPAKAAAADQKALQDMIDTAVGSNGQKGNVATAQDNLTSAQQTLAKDEALSAQYPTNAGYKTNIQIDREDITNAEAAVKNSQAYANEINQLVSTWKSGDPTKAGPSQLAYGALLFQTNCARCHTKAWSYFDPTKGEVPLPPPQGSGAFGPNLTNGDTLRQFPGDTGIQDQYTWIATGVDANKQYGTRGISSGRMPHFGTILNKDQIDAIIAYERSL
ncbi:MAG: cytochrome c [Actinobacteria bacterium]|nr:cytochrome c [Actinomycetota bacterium]